MCPQIPSRVISIIPNTDKNDFVQKHYDWVPKYERISGLRNFSGKATLSLAVKAINFTVANEKKTGN